jgi:hypothetical protein
VISKFETCIEDCMQLPFMVAFNKKSRLEKWFVAKGTVGLSAP